MADETIRWKREIILARRSLEVRYFFFFFLHLEFGMTMHEQKNIPNGTGNHGNLNFKRRYDGIR